MRILIVEDEPMIARRVERLSREILGDRLSHVRAIRTLEAARSYLQTTPIDVLFLDLNLHGQDGFDLLKTPASAAFQVVIVSAHTDQALRAFEFEVVDFLGKPFSRERLEKTYRRLLDAHDRADYAARYLSIRKAGRIDLVDLDDVRYVQGAGSYSELVLRDGSTELHDKSLDKLHALLPPIFERIHKSYIVRMSDVVRLLVHEGSRYEVVLHDGTHLPVGRTRYKKIRAKLEL